MNKKEENSDTELYRFRMEVFKRLIDLKIISEPTEVISENIFNAMKKYTKQIRLEELDIDDFILKEGERIIPESNIKVKMMKDIKNKVKQVKMKVVLPKDIPLYAPSGFFGGLIETEGLIKLWVDDLQPKINEENNFFTEFVLKKFVANIKFSPQLWKRMAYWMIKHVQKYEKQHGEIKIKGLKKTKNDDDDSVGYSYI